MKLLIVGTGVIGTIYGQVLSSGNEVFHYVRANKYLEKNNQLIQYDFIDERNKKGSQIVKGFYQYACVTAADDSYDLMILPVKTGQLCKTLEELAKQAPKSNYLLFTLDWNCMEQVETILPKEQFIVGYAGGGGTFKGDVLWGNVGKDVMLGTVSPVQQKLLERVDHLFQASGIVPEIPENALHWLWMHMVSTAPFGAGLAKYRDVSQCLEDGALLNHIFAACRECCLICEKRGVNLKQFSEAKLYTMPSFLYFLPIALMRRNFKKNPVMQRYTAHANDSIDEMCQNFKDIYKTGQAMNMDLPNMDFLNQILEKHEKSLML